MGPSFMLARRALDLGLSTEEEFLLELEELTVPIPDDAPQPTVDVPSGSPDP